MKGTNVRIRLPNGEVVDTGSGVPSRRSNKTRSGRSNVKGFHGRMWVSAVGGKATYEEAVYAPADYELCKVVPMSTGWLPDGSPRRTL